MPLPDERPRQSVANLIGRFENQTKRQPSSSSGSTRSSSVVSHSTGDSAKEETKEKREWPPKSNTTNERPSLIVPSSSWSRSQSSGSQPASPPHPESTATQPDFSEDATLTPRPSSTTSIPDAAKVVPPPQRQLSIGSSAVKPTSPSVHTPTTAKPPIKTLTPKAPVTATPKTPMKAGRTSTNHAPTTQPIKPQHTGPASSSTSSTRRPVTKSTPVTPAHAKTPSRAPPSASRPKTPTSTRPKTPSGLFAPTAASLARARNAQPQPPTPTKKATLSSSSADRLSKPTAASLSRARTPTAATSTPSRGAKPAVRGGTMRGTAKPGIGSPAARTKKETPPIPKIAKAGAATVAVAGAVGAIATASDSEHTTDNEDEHLEENGHHDEYPSSTATDSQDESQIDSRDVEDEAPIEVQEGQVGEEIGEHLEQADSETAEELLPTSPEVVLAAGSDEETKDIELDSSETALNPTLGTEDEPETIPLPDERVDEVKLRAPVGDDIEDMVNLLESVSISKPRPQSIASIPDEVDEIPDEE